MLSSLIPQLTKKFTNFLSLTKPFCNPVSSLEYFFPFHLQLYTHLLPLLNARTTFLLSAAWATQL